MMSRQFTIGRLMLIVAGSALALAAFRILRPFLFTIGFAVVPLASGYLASRVPERWATRAFFGSAAGLSLYLFLAYVYLPLYPDFGLLVGLFVLVPTALGFAVKWIGSRRGSLRRLGAAFVAVIVGLLPASMLRNRWPLELAFYLSSPALNRVADRVQAGGAVVPGEWAGFYRVRGARAMGYPATLIYLDANGRGGFVRAAGPPHGSRKERLGSGWQDEFDGWFD